MRYTECYNQLERYAKSSLESHVVRGIADVQISAGKVAKNIPLINMTPVDKGLKSAGKYIKGVDIGRVENVMRAFAQCKLSGENVFVNQLEMINTMHNHHVIMLFDKNNFYIADKKDETIA